MALLFAKSVGDGCQHSLVNDVVSELVKRGFFDKNIFDRFSILTSRGIQKRYFEASSRRNKVEVSKELLLIDVQNFSNVVIISSQNVDILNENADILTENVDILRQSKVKESKVKENIEPTVLCQSEIDPQPKVRRNQKQKIVDAFNEICKSYPKVSKLSDAREKAINARLNSKYTYEDFIKLFQLAEASDFLKGANGKNWSATFDWLIADKNMAKTLDGYYVNKSKGSEKLAGSGTSADDFKAGESSFRHRTKPYDDNR